VLVDGSPTRKKIKKDYDKALRDLARAREQLDQFHKADLPGFTRWLNTHFGALLTELRETSQKLAADEHLVFCVENEAMFGGGSYARAYQRVMEMRETPPPPPPPGGGDADGERDPFGGEPESEAFDANTDPMEAFLNELFDGFRPGDGPEKDEPDPWSDPRPAPPARSSRLKEIYRTLVRRLHPDTQEEMTAQKTEWWHQAQAAYQVGDQEQLEVILTLCEIGDSGTTAHTSASLLQRITARLKSSLREIKRQLTGLRRDPAWGFSGRADHEAMLFQMRHALTGDLEQLQARWRVSRELLADWKVAAERLRQPRRSKPRSRPQDIEFPF
jgi:hypothetical protein